MRNTSVQTLLASGLRILTAFSFLAPLMTRLVFGHAFYLTGRGKWMNFDNTVNFFSQLGIPFPDANAAFIASLEMIGGLLLIVGLGTRLVSGLLAATMVVALLTADRQGFVEALGSDLTGITPVVYLLALVWLVLYGAGRLSLDTILGRKIFQAQEKRMPPGNNHPLGVHST
ncbi:MAG: DoxX family protein [Bryobacteraceae bacterium]|nr:DoxX family protein [Bryobacteraceae bacterium]